MSDLTGQTVELLQAMIRNECVNDGTPDSGHETRNAELLTTYLEGAGLDVQTFSPRDGRGSIVARIEGTDPDAPKLCLMGHTDVVPVSPEGWSRDPFAGDVVDGEVWGRGAVDMLNITASMAVAFKHLADSNFRPKGDLIYFGVADEEAGGHWGAEWMVENHWDAIACDYVLTEMGGWSSTTADGAHRVTVNVAEKGIAWRRITVHGTPGHGSMPWGTDNALVKAAEVVRRVAGHRPPAYISDMWRAQVEAMKVTEEMKADLLDPARIWSALEQLPPLVARGCHAQTHTTFSPNVAQGGYKTNVIPDTVDVEVDIRTVPGTTQADVDDHLRDALGDLYEHVTVSPIQQFDATASPIGNALWDAIAARVQVAMPDAEVVPGLIVGGTDSRYFRHKGAVAYGAGLFSPSISYSTFATRFHGHDERIDVESLGLTTDFWLGVSNHLLT